MPQAKLNGVNIYYEVRGSGFSLVFCHEFAGDYRSWKEQVNFFSGKYQVITYNARGYPPSDLPTDPDAYSQDIAIEDLRGLLAYLGIEQTYICGLSMGGNVALNFALRYPSIARAIAVAATGAGSTDVAKLRRQVEELARAMEQRGMEAMAFYTTTPTRIQLKRKNPRVWQEFRDQFMEHSAIGSALTFRGVQGRRPSIFELKSQLRELRVPTLILAGDEDAPCIEPSIFMKRNIRTSGLVTFPQTGHTLNLEESALFNHSLDFFLRAVEEGKWAEYDPDALAGLMLAPEPGRDGG